jgi:hypothetical protein
MDQPLDEVYDSMIRALGDLEDDLNAHGHSLTTPQLEHRAELERIFFEARSRLVARYFHMVEEIVTARKTGWKVPVGVNFRLPDGIRHFLATNLATNRSDEIAATRGRPAVKKILRADTVYLTPMTFIRLKITTVFSAADFLVRAERKLYPPGTGDHRSLHYHDLRKAPTPHHEKDFRIAIKIFTKLLSESVKKFRAAVARSKKLEKYRTQRTIFMPNSPIVLDQLEELSVELENSVYAALADPLATITMGSVFATKQRIRDLLRKLWDNGVFVGSVSTEEQLWNHRVADLVEEELGLNWEST